MLWIIIFILLLMAFFLLFYVKMGVYYVYSAQGMQNILKVTIMGITVFKTGKKKKKKKTSDEPEKEKKKLSYEDFRKALDNWDTNKVTLKEDVKRAFKNLSRIAKIRKAHCDFTFGFSDAAKTGIAAGVSYGVVYGIFARLYEWFKMKEKNLSINVNPDFTKEVCELNLEFKLTVRSLFALLALKDIIKIYLALTK